MSTENGELSVANDVAGATSLASTTDSKTSETAASARTSAKDAVESLKAAAGSAKEAAATAAAHAKETGEQWRSQAGAFAGQAGDTIRSTAGTVKEKTGTALHGLSKLIADTAETVDARLGPQYGDYARQAAESVAGAARTLDEKDIDDLVSDAREFVRKSPAVTVGAAALVGFVLMRLARGGSKDS